MLLMSVAGVYRVCMAQNTVETHEMPDIYRSNWYLGVAGGSSSLTPEGDSAGFVAEGDGGGGGKLLLGWKFHPHWSSELGYTRAGSVKLSNPNPGIAALIPDPSIDYSITSLFVNYYFNSNDSRFNAFAKLGVSSIAVKPSDDRIVIVGDTSAPASLGLGAEFNFGNRWFLRVEHDQYSKDASFTGLMVGMRFGGSYGGQRHEKRLPVVIEYPLYVAEEQAHVLAEDKTTVTEVADELGDISKELLKASKEPSTRSTNRKESTRLAKQARILVGTSKRLAVVEESILRTRNVDITTIDKKTFVNEQGEPLLLTPAEQSVELAGAKWNIQKVEKQMQNYPYVRQRLSRVRGRIAVVQESLLYVPPWEEMEANRLCDDFAGKGENIHFDSESSRLTADSLQVLQDMVEKMNRNPRVIMEVHAHTDNRGTYGFNQKLSEERARATVDYLVEQGIARARLVAVGYGEWKPVASNKSPKGRGQNRRVEFVIRNPNICNNPGSPVKSAK